MRELRQRPRQRGNGLMEYAVPGAVILLTAGVLGTVLDIQGIMGDYFSAASGHNRSNMQGTTLNVALNSANLSGQTGTGAAGFEDRIIVTDGNGVKVEVGGTGGSSNLRGGGSGGVGGTNGTAQEGERNLPGGGIILNGSGQNVSYGAGGRTPMRAGGFAEDTFSGNSYDTANDDFESQGGMARSAMAEGVNPGQGRGGLARPEVAGTRGTDPDADTQKF